LKIDMDSLNEIRGRGIPAVLSGSPCIKPEEAPPAFQPQDRLSITEKSALGWALLAERIAGSKAFRKEQEVRSAVEETLKRPIKYVLDKIDGDDPPAETEKNEAGFWENHPKAKGWWLGFKGAKSFGLKALWQYPKALFTNILLPAIYSQTASDGRMTGAPLGLAAYALLAEKTRPQ
jgi:hypothetical protein